MKSRYQVTWYRYPIIQTTGVNTMRTITVEIPDFYEITSAKDAPEQYRTVSTANWQADIILAAVEFGLSESMGNTWSVGKKDIPTMQARHEAIERGDWARRAGKGGVTEAKLLANIGKLDVKKLLAALTPEQMAALVAANGDLSVITTKQL
jgi:hypothetical protein